MNKRRKLTEKSIIDELVAIGFAKATDYLFVEADQLGVKPTETLSDREAAAIATIEKSSTGLKVKFYDKIKALELLGKYLGMFEGKRAVVEENNLLSALLEGTKGEISTDDLQELQQAAEHRDDLVESA